MTILCENNGGNPVPELSVSIDGQVIEDSSHTFEMQENFHGKLVHCRAKNSLDKDPVQSDNSLLLFNCMIF